MKHYYTHVHQFTCRNLLIAYAAVFAMTVFTSPLQPAHADRITPPSVPTNLQAPAGHKVFLVGHAVGTQQYICLSPGTSSPWAFFGPQATLFKDDEKQILTHFLSPNPVEIDLPPRPTWQDSKDTSTVWGRVIDSSSDPAFVAPGAIPWLLLEVVGAQDGPIDGDKLTATTFIQRLNTLGGVAPSTGCALPTDIGKKALIDYETDYFFYKAAKNNVGGGN